MTRALTEINAILGTKCAFNNQQSLVLAAANLVMSKTVALLREFRILKRR